MSKTRHHFLLTYVTYDHDHETVEKISPQHAKKLVETGPHFSEMEYIERGGTQMYGETFLQNKLAVLVKPDKQGGERWVYRSDDNYYLTRPKTIPQTEDERDWLELEVDYGE
jgi:hypothetical protein